MKTIEKWEGAPRRALFIASIGFLFCLASAPAAAALTHYDITFTGATSAGTLPSGSFDYDPTTPTFANFTVTWDGVTFDLTAAANSPIWSNKPAQPAACTGSGAALSFQLLSDDSCLLTPPNEVGATRWEINVLGGGAFFDFVGGGGGQELFFSSPPEPYTFPDRDLCNESSIRCGQGEWQIAVVESVPEPATLALLGIGLAGLGFLAPQTIRRFHASRAPLQRGLLFAA